jgi:RHH-type proline utilization regulon transcriptional repressor/proline dehydrogenase/delta 1-pyrroline-5-carboxylate dehydrogenase
MEWAGNSRDFEFQRLHGMGDGLYERLVQENGYHCRVYAPVGGHRDLLAYLVRRLLENGANSSFVHQLADERLTEAEILADPVAKIAAVGGKRHPSIPLPVDLFGGGGHRNSAGLDLSDVGTLEATVAAVNSPLPRAGGTGGGLALSAGADVGVERAAANGSGGSECVPTPSPSRMREGDAVAAAITGAHAAFPAWSTTPVDERAACLERLADLLEKHRDELMAICVQEAFKTIGDAIGEVREAADFCRYYAQQARLNLHPIELPGPTGERNTLHIEGRGVWATIAPWNFPLAIFLGQTVAALVTGNTVVAKPAPQTPRIAARAVELAHAAGVPVDALILVPGGPEVGAALTSDVRIQGVAFTGSTATARKIARSLLEDDNRPIVPLIAETGGINAMIVDSTALPEQVVADVIASSFQSAGQRCSALRLLLVQEDIADGVIEMLSGAMETLRIGRSGDPATDVGPVIDQAAYDRLMGYRESVKAKIVKTLDAPAEGLFVPPTLVRIGAIEDLNQEWFGPILHVATWEAGKLSETIARVNAKGYGLTMGLHSRIARAAEVIEAEAAVGNLYINRSMIGAVVGSQPFGGEGLSGTGPKAGGPRYLYRFCAERAVSVDTTSAGGNATLLSLDEGGI